MPSIYHFDEVERRKLSAYYRGQDLKLHQIDTYDILDNLTEVFKDVMEHLHDTRQVFYKPVLILIKGGKG